jgi:hypothetical protein
VQLRQGGLTLADQILVAEKAGAWGEALALYQQAISKEAAELAAAGPTANTQGWGGNITTAAAAGAGSGGGSVYRTANSSWLGVMGAYDSTGSGGGAGIGQSIMEAMTQAATGLGPESKLGNLTSPEGSVATAVVPGPIAVAAAAGIALQSKPAGLSALQMGQLHCLLQVGHLNMLLRQVDGLMGRCMAAGGPENMCIQSALQQLSAVGVAAAWRLGAWQLVQGHLRLFHATETAAGVAYISNEDSWEVRILLMGFISLQIVSISNFLQSGTSLR